MPVNQNALLEGRIIELLTTTNLTFKEIILKLDSENLSASIGIIRRINRDNRYRRPRYDSKLTPAQRESLVDELRDHKGVKPNLSLLAKRYGVCHGSVWYWWDKLNRIKRFERSLMGSDGPGGRGAGKGGLVAGTGHGAAGLFGNNSIGNHQHQHYPYQHQFKTHGKSMFKRAHHVNMSSGGHATELAPAPQSLSSSLLLDNRYNLIGRVSIVTRDNLNLIHLPILMFSKRIGRPEAPVGLELPAAVPVAQLTNDELFMSNHLQGQQHMFRLERRTGATVI